MRGEIPTRGDLLLAELVATESERDREAILARCERDYGAGFAGVVRNTLREVLLDRFLRGGADYVRA